jgi:hypothetical protein
VRKINVAKDFSPVPSGRVPEDGPDSGQRFREEILLPSLSGASSVAIFIDDAVGYQSSFLEEAFGPLQKLTGLTGDELSQRIVIESSDPEFALFKELIERFMREGRN